MPVSGSWHNSTEAGRSVVSVLWQNRELAETFASISYGADEGRSSLADDRLRRYDRRPYKQIVAPEDFLCAANPTQQLKFWSLSFLLRR